jgi:hypothetical protein
MNCIFVYQTIIDYAKLFMKKYNGIPHKKILATPLMTDCQLACLASEQTFFGPQENIRSDQICVDAHPKVLLLQRMGTQLVIEKPTNKLVGLVECLHEILKGTF